MRPTNTEVWEAVRKIQKSHGLCKSKRLKALLEHLVEKTLDGRTDELKESLIGVDVFGRSPSWDTKKDATVRVHMAKLRRGLREYYESTGKEEDIVIELDPGLYAPAIESRMKAIVDVPVATPGPATAPAVGYEEPGDDDSILMKVVRGVFFVMFFPAMWAYTQTVKDLEKK